MSEMCTVTHRGITCGKESTVSVNATCTGCPPVKRTHTALICDADLTEYVSENVQCRWCKTTLKVKDWMAIAPSSAPTYDPVAMRINDAQRDTVLQKLDTAFAEGALTKEVLDERQLKVMMSVHESDLAGLTDDLPVHTDTIQVMPAAPTRAPFFPACTALVFLLGMIIGALLVTLLNIS